MPPAAPVNADRLSSRPLSRQSGSSPRSRHSGSRAPAPPALTLHTALSADELSHHRQHGQARGQLTLPTPPLTAVKQRGVQGKSRSGGSGSYARPKTRSEKTRQPPKEGTCLHCGCDHVSHQSNGSCEILGDVEERRSGADGLDPGKAVAFESLAGCDEGRSALLQVRYLCESNILPLPLLVYSLSLTPHWPASSDDDR